MKSVSLNFKFSIRTGTFYSRLVKIRKWGPKHAEIIGHRDAAAFHTPVIFRARTIGHALIWQAESSGLWSEIGGHGGAFTRLRTNGVM